MIGINSKLVILKEKLAGVHKSLPYLQETLPESIIQGYIRDLEKRIDSLLTNAEINHEQVALNSDKLE